MAKKTDPDVQFAINAAKDALLDASLKGFPRLKFGDILVDQKSSSSVVSEMQADLAARQIEHCLEAWEYLSQAILAMLGCQDDIAIHMAYYSELRSANSLLAATGIANKENKSYFIDSAQKRKACNVKTHKFVRDIWHDWCKRPDTVEAFTSLKVLPSVTLLDVYNSLNLRQSPSQSLLKWGYELLHFDKDHTSRNRSSYQVYRVYHGVGDSDSKKHGDLLSLIWSHLSSTGSDGQLYFEKIYAQYLLAGACKDYSSGAEDEESEFAKKLQSTLEQLSKNTGVPVESLRTHFDFEKDDSRFDLFDIAASSNTDVKNVVARAFILARFATNKLNVNLSKSKCQQALEWIRRWLEESGVLHDDVSREDVVGSSESFADAADEIAELNLRRVWLEEPESASRAGQLKASLCWGIEF
ncbi:hypothetical protein [Marinobacter sp. HN1S83]|uniref:hypothetical protein n=1 Tax=Marinobacter sp. HN1S83 TaxID=3382301 RepID=UPI00387ACF5E